MALPLVAIGALAKLAPGVIRAAGELLGGKARDAAGVVADVLDGGGDLSGAVESMPAEIRVELGRLANEATALDNERRARELQHEETLHTETQKTARSEQEHGTAYVKETRPRIARQSFYAGSFYVIALALLQSAGHGGGPDAIIAATLFSPCLGYLGVRTVDKWKGKTGTTV